MNIPPSYTITPNIIHLITQIEANRLFLQSYPIQKEVKINIARKSLLKSSLFSARIEGNPLTIDEFPYTGDILRKKEIFNILDGLKYIDQHTKKDNLSMDDLLNLHSLVLKDISITAGRIRKEIGAIFNEAGIAVYVSPSPQQVPKLLKDLLQYLNSRDVQFPLIIALIGHLIFEKIHPFVDGNGRVGRLLISAVLKIKNWEFPIPIPLEEYIDTHKQEYYSHLDKGLSKVEEYLEYMLTGFLEEMEKIKQEVKISAGENQLLLPPRQEEIYSIIKDHRQVTFDFIRRRFIKIPERTLRYDLHKLCQKEYLVKIGNTRGAFYSTKK